ncbi:MAG: alpha/beta hydrolase fold domain-containing protein [Limimaricola sp.]|uniref:alpha/beta hydrolase n=1 Tax=Limimaricola sp. TaxID=2211665 RepID=UPI001DEE789C|nr:alpha/beta hydrolase [Limimaricola sp.]MBI1415702.1 alpha/beta hydrolase fold domain-containing protein [Limimaricola sp.]
MTVLRDIAYADRSDRNRLDLYLPDGVARPPLVFFIHGGAFLMGSKDAPLGKDAFLAAGFAVAAANYRYASQAIWPAQLEDLTEALAWLRANAARHGFDGTRIAAFGPSAGGHLTAVCAIAHAADPATRLAAAVSWFPPVDFPTMDADMAASGVTPAAGPNGRPDSPESQLTGVTVGEEPEGARAANPLRYLDALPADALLPPFLIMHGALDPLIAPRQSHRLLAGLAAFGNAPRLALEILPGGTHGGGDFEQPAAIDRVVNFLHQSFGA